MIYRGIGLLIFATFYLFYLAKLVIQKKQGIKTNQMGSGNKPKRVLVIERIMSVATVLTVIAGLVSIFVAGDFQEAKAGVVPETEPGQLVGRLIGITMGLLAVIIFASATITMKYNWRVGIPEEKTELVTEGIYRWSRNPAFLGFDLLYVSMCIMFFNLPLVVVSVWAAVMLHLQILQEEDHMECVFGAEYIAYKERTGRYFGRKG